MNLKQLAALVGALTVIIGTAFAIDSRYVHVTPDFIALNQAFQEYRIDQAEISTQEKLWQVQDRKKVAPNPDLDQRERELQFQLEQLKSQKEKLQKINN